MVLNGNASSSLLMWDVRSIPNRVDNALARSPLVTWALTSVVVVTTSGGRPSDCFRQFGDKRSAVSLQRIAYVEQGASEARVQDIVALRSQQWK